MWLEEEMGLKEGRDGGIGRTSRFVFTLCTCKGQRIFFEKILKIKYLKINIVEHKN